jgi:arsenical resistance operon trans-acting repressor ArsD
MNVVERKRVMKLEVFDPAMCCSTGVCGPSVDPALPTFAADLDWLTSTGATVRRYNLGQEPGEFAGNERVRALLQEQGEAALPVVFTDGELRSSGRYPTRDEIVAWSTTTAPAVSAEAAGTAAEVSASGCFASPEPVTLGAAPTPARGCC